MDINKSKERASLLAQLVKNPLAMQQMHVQSIGQEDPLEKEMATQEVDTTQDAKGVETTTTYQISDVTRDA